MNRILSRFRPQPTRQQALASIRQQMAAMGAPVDHLSDDELEAFILRLQRVAASFGMSLEQAGRAFEAFGRSFAATFTSSAHIR